MTSTPALRAGCEDTFDGVLELARGFGAADWSRATGCPGWDVRDNVAHIVTLEQVILGDDLGVVLQADLVDTRPHVRDVIGQYMEALIDPWRSRSTDELLAATIETFDRRRAQMAAWSDTDWTDGLVATPGGGTAAPARFLPIRVFDMFAHEQDIRRAVGVPGHLEGPAVDVALTRCARGFGAVFSRVAGGRTGTFSLHVDGPTTHDFSIELADGRASEHVAEAPVVGLAGSISDIVALGCGRSDAPDPATMAWTGDLELARVLQGHLAFTP